MFVSSIILIPGSPSACYLNFLPAGCITEGCSSYESMNSLTVVIATDSAAKMGYILLSV